MNKKEKALRPGKKQLAEVYPKVTVDRSKGSGIPTKDSGYIDRNPGKDNQHNRDISSKTVFGNAILCAQFLRDNFDMPVLRDVQPEDIEDISERFYPYLGTEFEADSVKKIRILDIGKKREDGRKEPPFLVSLIEHKSLVDYDVSMQLLRYMICIWAEYRREKEAEQEGYTRQKGFRYPVIIPIVYYEGKAEWTAGMQLSDRIGGDTGSRKWIPDFRYELIRIHDYSDQELLDRENEMSLIMLINKIQNTADLERFIHIPADRLDRIVQSSPEAVVDIMAAVMENLCFKIDISAEERLQCVQKVKTRRMGYLFENMEKMSLQEERRKTEEQRKKTEEERKRADKEYERAEEEHGKAEVERKRADKEYERAEEEHRKAEEERKRTEEERKRADEAEEKLRLAEEKLNLLSEKYQSKE